MKNLLLTVTMVTVIIISSCSKQGATHEEGPYFPQVKQIIQQHCLSCHSPGGNGMPVILTEDSDIVNNASSIKVATTGPFTFYTKQMPPDGELSESDKTVIINWYALGGTATD